MRIAQYPWYDAWWLEAYVSARDTLAASSPAVLPRFVDAIEPLRTRADFVPVVFDEVLDPAELERVRQQVVALGRRDLDLTDLDEARRFGRFIRRNLPAFTDLHRRLASTVAEAVGEPVEPTYNFLSLYGAPGVCEPHLDAPAAKWTLDICLSQSQPWPIHFSQVVPWPEAGIGTSAWQTSIRSSRGLVFTPVTLMPGQAVIFSGSAQWHYRDPMPSGPGRQHCDLLFLHYVPAGTRDVVRPEKWAELFSADVLAGFSGLEDAFI